MISKGKKLKTMENRLQQLQIKYSKTVNQNKDLRETIQNIRRQKQQQIQIKDKLDRQLFAKNQEKLNVLQQQQASIDARDYCQRDMDALQAQIVEETEEFETEMENQREHLKEEEEAAKHIGMAKATKMHAAAKSKELAKSAEATNADNSQLGNMSSDEEAKMRGQNNKAYWSIAKKEVDLKRQTERVQAYEEAFAKIQQETGIESIEKMVTEFIQAEDDNFSLFNMINGLNRKMEELEVQNGDIKVQIEQMRALQGGGEERQSMKTDREKQIKLSEDKAAFHKGKLDKDLKVVDSMKQGITSIFVKVGCNDEALGQQLSSTGVTDMNITQFLGIIEERIEEIVQMHHTFQEKEPTHESKDEGGSNENARPKGSRAIAALSKSEVPSTHDEDDDENADRDALKPISIEETIAEMKQKGYHKHSKHKNAASSVNSASSRQQAAEAAALKPK
jgi:hypothetical protein